MATYTDSTAFFPEQYGQLVDNAIKNQAVAAQVLSTVRAAGTTMAFPVLAADPSTAWTAEGAEISLTDPDLDELVVTPMKVAGLSKISNEAANDSSPALAQVIGNGLSRQIVEKIDSALFAASTPTNGAPGLQATGITEQEADLLTATNEDAFLAAKFTAIDNGAQLSAFVLASDVAAHLASVKVASGSAQRLLQHDADGNLTVGGLPAYISRHVGDGEAFGIDRSQSFMVLREGTTVVADRSAAFSSDSVLVRATARVAFAVTNPAGVVHIVPAA